MLSVSALWVRWIDWGVDQVVVSVMSWWTYALHLFCTWLLSTQRVFLILANLVVKMLLTLDNWVRLLINLFETLRSRVDVFGEASLLTFFFICLDKILWGSLRRGLLTLGWLPVGILFVSDPRQASLLLSDGLGLADLLRVVSLAWSLLSWCIGWSIWFWWNQLIWAVWLGIVGARQFLLQVCHILDWIVTNHYSLSVWEKDRLHELGSHLLTHRWEDLSWCLQSCIAYVIFRSLCRLKVNLLGDVRIQVLCSSQILRHSHELSARRPLRRSDIEHHLYHSVEVFWVLFGQTFVLSF